MSGETHPAEDDRLWSVAELAAYLGVPVATIYHWRTRGYGPRGVRIGRFVRFRAVDVQAWVAAIVEVA